VENITGQALQIGPTWASEIEGNYFESCFAYIDLKTLNLWYHFGLKLSTNHFGLTPQQITDNVVAITVGDTNSHADYGDGSMVSYCNTSTGILYDLAFTSPASYITGIGDSGTIQGTANKYIQLSKPYYRTNADGSVLTGFGFNAQLINSLTVTLSAGQTSAFTIPFQDGLILGDLCSVVFNNAYNVQLLSTQIVTGGLYVWVKNLDTVNPATKTLCATIMRMGIIV